jgi:hypothetical protein
MYWSRRLRQRLYCERTEGGRDEYGDSVVSPYGYPTPVRPFKAIPLDEVYQRFSQIHAANEYLRNNDGSWDPHPRTGLFGCGIPLEEVSDRVLGYLGAYEAFGDPVFLQRAEEGGRYLLEKRVFSTGHLRLEGHHVIELVYSYAGIALLALWEHDRSRSEYLEAAIRIADRLVEEHIGGAVDHALKVAQLLAPLYRITGNEAYLKASLRRTYRAVALQLPYGGWLGADARIWYHCIIARGVLDTYVATPNTLRYYVKKDHIARCITAALNRVVLSQDERGHVKIGRGEGSRDPLYAQQTAVLRDGTVRFTGDGFEPASMDLRDFAPRDVMDFLTAAFEELTIQPAAVAAHGFARVVMGTELIHRLEFETYMVGRYAQFVHRLRGRSAMTRKRTGVGQVEAYRPMHQNGVGQLN